MAHTTDRLRLDADAIFALAASGLGRKAVAEAIGVTDKQLGDWCHHRRLRPWGGRPSHAAPMAPPERVRERVSELRRVADFTASEAFEIAERAKRDSRRG